MSQHNLNEWPERLEAGNTDDPTLILAAQLEAQRTVAMPMSPDFKTELRNRLLMEYEQSSSIKRWRFGLLLNLRWLTLAGGLTILIVAVIVVLFSRPQSVSAAEIMARAAAVSTHADNLGAQSYQGIIFSEAYGNKNQTYIWSQAPDHERIEVYSYRPLAAANPDARMLSVCSTWAQPGDTAYHLDYAVVSDGSTGWFCDAIGNNITKNDGDLSYFVAAYLPWNGIQGYAENNGDLQAILQAAGHDFQEAKLVGTDTVANRSVYVIELTPKPSKDKFLSSLEKIILKIDQQTYLQLAVELRGKYVTLISRKAFESISINTPIAPEVFTFTPPTGAKVSELHVKVAPSAEELAQLWTQIAQSAHFKIFKPTVIPDYLVPHGPVLNTEAGRERVNQNYRTKSGTLFVILEFAQPKGIPLINQGEKIQVGVYKGDYEESFGSTTLAIVRDDTLIELIVQGQVSKDDLVKMAASMEEVPTSTTGAAPQTPASTATTAAQ